jgi:hypothetical protein
MGYKNVECKTTVGAAISDAFAEFTTLAEEMESWADNMPESKQGSAKHDEVEAAKDELENHNSEPNVPEFLADIPVTYTEQRKSGKRGGPSRSVRLGNAQGMLQAARDVIQAFIDKDDADLDTNDNDAVVDKKEDAVAARKEEAESFIRDELDEHCEFDVDFPGMFG